MGTHSSEEAYTFVALLLRKRTRQLEKTCKNYKKLVIGATYIRYFSNLTSKSDSTPKNKWKWPFKRVSRPIKTPENSKRNKKMPLLLDNIKSKNDQNLHFSVENLLKSHFSVEIYWKYTFSVENLLKNRAARAARGGASPLPSRTPSREYDF